MMLYTISNNRITVQIDSWGAQIMSLKTADQVEYLWQGDETYWRNRAPVLFPFVGRLAGGKYLHNGTQYQVGLHGFARDFEFTVEVQEDEKLVMCLKDNEKTREMYPFGFLFRITYSLLDTKLQISWEVNNENECVMPFGIGGHPGFNVPLIQGERFEDYILEFPMVSQPSRIGFTTTAHLSGIDLPYELEEGQRIRLRHDLFEHEAIVLKNMPREVTIRNGDGSRGVRVCFPDIPYIGFWHTSMTDAPYVCVEPWVSLPGRHEITEEITCKSDLIQLRPHKSWQTQWTIELF